MLLHSSMITGARADDKFSGDWMLLTRVTFEHPLTALLFVIHTYNFEQYELQSVEIGSFVEATSGLAHGSFGHPMFFLKKKHLWEQVEH